ncbi:DNA/RNA helicase, superfamily I [Bradyrhizobium sp. YR681]|uniref:ATP-binding domain-containing protein n=1 Tax=Bradyrhizobium sp. YR681 TaxID=1144344 RepID=UPI00026F6373|nr:ATP-binding domain-containing protein [Bradyrhizobium sp. YR681]EJN07136.1 DNA/RNA helicase, superfamily I [Bradyrhizobium sp. YR681]
MESSWWKDLSQLDDEQRKVISLSDDVDHLVVGPPGCGKTNLLLLRASYLHKKGSTNIKVLAFGRVLKEFIASGTAHYPFSADKVQTFMRWAYEILSANGISIDEDEDFDKIRDQMFARLGEIAAMQKAEDVYDVILLDEAQDYSADEVSIVRSFGERIFAVGDNNQRITKKTGALEKLAELGAETATLHHHYRNGIKICRVADGIKNIIDHPSGMEATSNYDEAAYPSTVEVLGQLKIDTQVVEAVKRIKTQLQAYPGEMIGVLCPRAEDLKAVAEQICASEIGGEVQVQRAGAYTAIISGRPVVVTTVQGAKGLEFRAVHLMAADKLKKFATQKNLTYTAVTRAKTTLVVYHEEGLAGYFEKGLEACEITKPGEPNLKDLFL